MNKVMSIDEWYEHVERERMRKIEHECRMHDIIFSSREPDGDDEEEQDEE